MIVGRLRSPQRAKPRRRRLAQALLFVFVWDLGFHLLAPLHSLPNLAPAEMMLAGDEDTGSSDDHSDCGMPGHGCALSHHHHFPALLSHSYFTIPLRALRPAEWVYRVPIGHTPLAAGLIRAPPSL